MTARMTMRDRSISGRRRCDQAAFRRLVVATYPVFLVIAVVHTALAAIGITRGSAGGGSVFARARSMAHAVIPFAFMG
jgi:hypothetical protein